MDKKKVFLTIVLVLLGFFLLLFFGRVVYDYLVFGDYVSVTGYYNYATSDEPGEVRMVKNIASAPVAAGDTGGSLDESAQKYERVASLSSKTSRFDSDLGLFWDEVERYSAVIQLENRRGLEGSRRADFVIGVSPDSFEAMEDALRQIGDITAFSVTKTDRTMEYRQLLADLQTLKLRLEGYQKLKEQSGSISEMLALEDKIIEVDGEIMQHELGLNTYRGENGLCTINFTLYEGNARTFFDRVWASLEWAAQVYIMILLALLLLSLLALLVTALILFMQRVLRERPQSTGHAKAEPPLDEGQGPTPQP